MDLPPEFPQSNLRSWYTALGKLLPSRPELDRLVGQFVQERQLAPPSPEDPAPHAPQFDGAARVAAVHRANKAGGGSKPPGKGKGGADYDKYSVAMIVKWRINPQDPPEPIFLMSPGPQGMVLKKSLGDFRVSYIKDEGQLYYMEEGGSAIVGMRPEAPRVVEQNGGDSSKRFSYEWSKANRQPYARGFLQAHHLEQSTAIAQSLRRGDLLVFPHKVAQPRDGDGAGDECHKRRRSPSVSPPGTSCKSEDDYTPRRGGRCSSPEEERYRGGQRHTPHSSSVQRDN